MTYELYRGPSQLDGSEVVCLLTTNSANRKTGPVIQSWIMRTDMPPNEAVSTGADAAVCGDCKLRGRACYVLPWQAPTVAWRAWSKQPRPAPRYLLHEQDLRIGAYGDPAALPFEVWEAAARHTRSVTGFTHQWRRCDPRFRQLLMASCDTLADAQEAQAMGWRTFRITLQPEKLPGEVVCPNHTKGLTCQQCRCCDGHRSGRRANVTTPVHGAKYKIDAFKVIVENR